MFTRFLDLLINTGYLGLVITGFLEPVFLPFPMEVVYIPVALANTSKAFYYVVLLIFCSFIGSCVAYSIGRIGGKKIEIRFRAWGDHFAKIQDIYNKNSFLAIATSSFTPIPYEVYSYSAGIFKINFKKFVIASILSRIIRFIPQSILILVYGENVKILIKKYGIFSTLVLFLFIMMLREIYVRKIKDR